MEHQANICPLGSMLVEKEVSWSPSAQLWSETVVVNLEANLEEVYVVDAKKSSICTGGHGKL